MWLEFGATIVLAITVLLTKHQKGSQPSQG